MKDVKIIKCFTFIIFGQYIVEINLNTQGNILKQKQLNLYSIQLFYRLMVMVVYSKIGVLV